MFNRQRLRADETKFQDLIASPTDLAADDLVLPANGRLALSVDGAVGQGDISIAFKDRTITTPDLEADTYHHLGWFEVGSTFTITCSTAVNLKVYMVTMIGQFREIGNGAF